MPTDDLCNYIENKANQNNEAAGLNSVSGGLGGVNAPNGSRGASKIKKRQPPGQLSGTQNNSSMSIEDQESKRLEQ